MEDPYADAPRKCILCTHSVDLDYKVCGPITVCVEITLLIVFDSYILAFCSLCL